MAPETSKVTEVTTPAPAPASSPEATSLTAGTVAENGTEASDRTIKNKRQQSGPKLQEAAAYSILGRLTMLTSQSIETLKSKVKAAGIKLVSGLASQAVMIADVIEPLTALLVKQRHSDDKTVRQWSRKELGNFLAVECGVFEQRTKDAVQTTNVGRYLDLAKWSSPMLQSPDIQAALSDGVVFKALNEKREFETKKYLTAVDALRDSGLSMSAIHDTFAKQISEWRADNDKGTKRAGRPKTRNEAVKVIADKAAGLSVKMIGEKDGKPAEILVKVANDKNAAVQAIVAIAGAHAGQYTTADHKRVFEAMGPAKAGKPDKTS